MPHIQVIFNEKQKSSLLSRSLIEATGLILSNFAKKVPFMSIEGIQGIINSAFDTTSELSEKQDSRERSALSRKRKLITDKINWYKTFPDMEEGRKNALQAFYDFILTTEKLSALPGFGFVMMEKNEEGRRSVKSPNLLNPEKASIYRDY